MQYSVTHCAGTAPRGQERARAHMAAGARRHETAPSSSWRGLDAAHALARAVPSFKLHAACAVCVGVFPEMGPYSRDSGLRVSFFDAETLILFQETWGHFYFRFIKISHEDRISFLNPVSRLYRPQIFVTMRLSTALSM